MQIKEISSRQNEFIKEINQLVRQNTAHHKAGKIWLEGEHLCQAYLEKVGSPQSIICSKSAYNRLCFQHLLDVNVELLYLLDDDLFNQVSGLESKNSKNGIAYLIKQEKSNQIDPLASSIILDRLQDPGNVGSILRSAAAFGFKQIIALNGCTALWGQKVLRAGMGAHFSLSLFEKVDKDIVATLNVPLLATSSHAQTSLHRTKLPWPCAWILGHEGQGIEKSLLGQSDLTVCIEQPGGEESLNAAIAASICMHESIRYLE